MPILPENPLRQPHWRVLLLCALFFGGIVLFTNTSQPQATDASALPKSAIIEQPDQVKHLPAASPVAPVLDSLATTPSLWPAAGPVTSWFGQRVSPFGDGNELHQGIDIASAAGTPVVATADGQVVQSGWSGGYGNIVQLDHGNGITTIYGHNSSVAVASGQPVKKGQVISFAGSTGRSTGSHVHYEVRVNNAPVDPRKYLIAE